MDLSTQASSKKSTQKSRRSRKKIEKKFRAPRVKVRTPPKYDFSSSDDEILLQGPKAPPKQVPLTDKLYCLESKVFGLFEKLEEEKEDTNRYSTAKKSQKNPCLASELDNRKLTAEEIERKEYECFTKFAYSDTPGMLQEVAKIRKMREHLKYTDPDNYY